MEAAASKKIEWWVKQRVNVMFRHRDRVGTAKMLKFALDDAALKWCYISAHGAKVNQIFADDSIEAFFFDDLDWTKRGFRNVVLDLLNQKDARLPNLKFIWATLSISDVEDELDLEHYDPAQAEAFDVVVVC